MKKQAKPIPASAKVGAFLGWLAAKTVNGAELAALHAKIVARSTKQAYKITRG